MIDDELPMNDLDEIAVEEEFKKKATEPSPSSPSSTTVTNANTVTEAAPQNPMPESKTQPSIPSSTVTQQSPASPKPRQSNKPAPRPATPPQPRPMPSAPAMPSAPMNPPSQSSSSPDIDRLRNIAKSSGLSTSMDSLGKNDNAMVFDIEVIEEDDDGRPSSRIERGVSASSEAEIRSLYAMSGQRIRIIKRYGPAGSSPIPQSAQPASYPPSQQNSPEFASTHYPSQSPQPAYAEKPAVSEPPKYFNVSGVECKLENGKVYQRQWVRLAGSDAEAFRLVNDANNKIVPIDGKHIEQKKWVLIQENADEGE